MVWLEMVVLMMTVVITFITAGVTVRHSRQEKDLADRVRLEAAGGPWDPERRAALKTAWLELEQHFGREMTPTPPWVHAQPKPRPKRPDPRLGAGVERPSIRNPDRAKQRAKLQRDLDRLKAEADTLKALKALDHPGLAEQIEALTNQWRRTSEKLGNELEAMFPVHKEIGAAVGDYSYAIEANEADRRRLVSGGFLTVPNTMTEAEIDALKRGWKERVAAGKVTPMMENLAIVRDAERKAIQAACVHDTVVYKEGDLPTECRCAKCHRRFSRHVG